MLSDEEKKEINLLKRAFKKDGARYPVYENEDENPFKLPEKLQKKIEEAKNDNEST